MVLSDLWMAVGFLLLVEGVPLFLSPGRYRSLLARIEAVPDATLRMTGLIGMGMGLAILYMVR